MDSLTVIFEFCVLSSSIIIKIKTCFELLTGRKFISSYKNILLSTHIIIMWYLLLLLSALLQLNTLVFTYACTSTQYFSNPHDLFTNGISNSKSGSCLILLDGIYNYDAAITIKKVSNISIKAETVGGVIFSSILTGINIKIESSASNILIEGFQFVNGYSINQLNILDVLGSNNTLSQLNFYNMTATKYVNIKVPSQYNTIINCNFEYKPVNAPPGNLVEINADESVIGYHKIQNCTFYNLPGNGGDNGNEPIRLGESTESKYISRTIIEYCVFNNTGLGDSESISIKSNENIVRYSTFASNQYAMLSFRNCDYNVAYSNFFLGAGGCRIKQANNIFIYNNYFESSGIYKDRTYPIEFRNLTGYGPYYLYRINVTIQFNTFVNSEYIELDTVQKFNNNWSNNIFYQSNPKKYLFDGSTAGTTFDSNVYFGTLGKNNTFINVSPSELVYSNPLLFRNTDDYYQPELDSPAVHSSNNMSIYLNYDIPILDDDPSISLDITGRYRPTDSNKDVGCSQYDAFGKVLNAPRSIYNTGPSCKLTFNLNRD